jgi:hypothetical protein
MSIVDVVDAIVDVTLEIVTDVVVLSSTPVVHVAKKASVTPMRTPIRSSGSFAGL